MRKSLPALIGAVIALTAGCKSGPSGNSPAPSSPSAETSATSAAPAAVSSTSESREHKGLPDPTLTPGERGANPVPRTAVDPAVARKVLQAYDVRPGDARTVICRLYPPEIGGTNNPANLFVTTPWFADVKARLDTKLAALVKSKQITAQQAAADLKANWVKASHKYYVRNYGEGDKEAARKKEDELRWEH